MLANLKIEREVRVVKKMKGFICGVLAIAMFFGDTTGVFASNVDAAVVVESQESKTLSFGTVYQGRILSEEQKDIYTIQVPVDGKMKFYVDYNIKDSYKIQLVNTDSNVIFDDTTLSYDKDTVNGRYIQERGYFRVPAGNYTLTVMCAGEACTDVYSLKTEYLKEEVQNYEKESNDTPVEATEIKTETTYYGNFSTSDDKDYYKIVLDEAGTLEVNLKGPDGAFFPCGVYSVETSGELKCIKSTYICSSAAKNGKVQMAMRVPAGTYFLMFNNKEEIGLVGVDINRYVNEDYSFDVVYTLEEENFYEREFNNTRATATKLPVNTPLKGDVANYDDKDYYVVELEETGSLQMKVTLPKGKYYDMVLYRADENGETEKLEAKSAIASKNKVVNFKKQKVKAGIYYVLVDGNMDSYTICADFYPNSQIGKTKKVKAKSLACDSVEVTWKRVKNASVYRIYRSTSKEGTYKEVGKVKGQYTTSFTDTKLKTGQKYFYKVMACVGMDGHKEKKGKYSAQVSVTPVPGQVLNVTVEKTADGVSIKWDKLSGASGYEVKCVENNKKYKIKKRSKVAYTIKSLESGKVYQFKVRAYKTVKGKKLYGAYSDVVKVQM